MAIFKERESLEGKISERPEEISPLSIEHKEVITPTQSQFKAQVVDNAGRPVIQTPPSSVVTISVPANTNQLSTWSKGSPNDALTWFSVFWQRVIKKALHFGWRIVGGKAQT
jgi:hypothetical protein